MSKKKHRYARVLAIGALLAVGLGGAMAEGIYREYVPRVDIDPAKYSVALDTSLCLKVDANGSNKDARDLSVILTFVLE